MFALMCGGSNGEVISRHRTMEAAAKKYAKLQREAKNESSLAYVPADLRKLVRGSPQLLDGEEFKQWDQMKKATM